ncbi:MAG: alpha/beta hydrolase [Rhodobacteraceae bacterium]|nr:alpha/beta hydrolase [Paracoccaceae bacterium]
MTQSPAIQHIEIGAEDAPRVVFAHGWGRSHRDFIPAAEALAPVARSVLADLPGFGASPRPKAAWDTADYADALAEALRGGLMRGPVVWVGHSFGGRIGLRMAVRHPELLSGLVLVAAAGIPRAQSVAARLRGGWRSWRFRRLKAQAADDGALLALEERFGSADYVQSRRDGLRDIFLKTIAEDQSADLARIAVPTTLIYGGRDTETPPEIGHRMAHAIPGAEYVELAPCDHISVLDRGRHQIALAVKEKLRAAPGKAA